MGEPFLIATFAVCVRNLDAKDKKGATPLHYATAYSLLKTLSLSGIPWQPGEAIWALLQEGANVNAKDNSGNTPLHYLMESQAPTHWVTAITDTFVKAGANIDVKNKDGDTVLHIAATNLFKPDYIEALADRGKLLNATNNKGRTPLHVAALLLFYPHVKSLLDKGAYIGIKDNSGYTPLELAQNRNVKGKIDSENKREIVKLLKK